MRVAYVMPELSQRSGWRTMGIGVIRSLRSRVEPTLIVSQDECSHAQELFEGISIVPVPRTQLAGLRSPRAWADFGRTWLAIKNLPQLNVDLIHSLEAYPAGWVAQQIAERARVPYLLSPVGTYSVLWRQFGMDRRLYSQVLRDSAYLCPISHGTLNLMRIYFGPAMENTPTEVVLVGTYASRLVSGEEARQHNPANPPLLLSVGEIKPRKGYDIALKAFRLIQQQMPEVHYRLIGSTRYSGYVSQLQAYIEAHRLRGVEFMNNVSDEVLHNSYRDASVFLLTPRIDRDQFEGFGQVYLEAGAFGVPVVGTRSGGVPDAVKHEVTGLLAESENPDDVADAVLKLLNDPATMQAMGRANREWCESLSWEKYAERQYAVYQRILN